MNIDERLEALTQTVELIAHAQIKNDERIEKLTGGMERLTGDVGKLTALLAQTDGFINQLARIAEAHEHRIERLEGK
jgi:hypothetical protein